MMKVAETAYLAVQASSVARVDIRYDPSKDRIVVLEINTIPGLTATSLAPLAAEHYLGLSFS